MFKNYLLLGFRNLKKHKLSSFINIAGLALAVGCCFMVFEFSYWSFHQDSFNTKIDKLFVLERVVDKNGALQNYGNAPEALGPALKNEFQQVKNVARLKYKNVVIKQGNNVLRDQVTFVDDAFYTMFDYPVKWGNKQHFTDKNGIVLTEELSDKLFGKSNSLGKRVNVKFNVNEVLESFEVKGVFAKQPNAASFYFSAMLPYSKMTGLGMTKPGDWKQTTDITFIEADNAASLKTLSTQTNKYLKQYNAANPDDQTAALYYQPFKTMQSHAYEVNKQHFNTTKPAGLIMLIVIAIAILLLVYFNYINITIASAAGRLKEISVRKVMGSSRGQIIGQFVTENLMLCTIAVVAGLFLAEIFFFPWFSSISGFDLGQDFFMQSRTWFAALGLIVISAISGAVYPSLYISSFTTVGIMRGKTALGSKNTFRKALLGLQFFLTFLAISLAIAFVQETKHLKEKPWGYDPANTIAVTLDNSSRYEVLKADLKGNSEVKSITGSVQPLGRYAKEILIKKEGSNEAVKSMEVLPGFITETGIKLSAGRDFKDNSISDQQSGIIVNEAFVTMMKWTNAIGKNVRYNDINYTVIGQVADFHYENFEYKVAPMVLMSCTPEQVKYLYVKTSESLFSNAGTTVKNIWQKLYPDLPFDYQYQDDVFHDYFRGFDQVTQVLAVTSLIMTIISISGVFGLALIILSKKMKEISVRKVLGAGIQAVSYQIYKEFLSALVIAIVLGLPLSIWLISTMFDQLSSNSSFSVLPVAMSVIALVFSTGLSVSWHILKAHSANISQFLKDE